MLKKSEYQKEWFKTEAGKSYKEKHKDYQKEWRDANREQYNASRTAAQFRVRQEALEHYGGKPPKCSTCNSIDDLRISPLRPGESPYSLRKAGYPSGRKILCFSCVKKERGTRIQTNEIWRDPETGKHRKDLRSEVKCGHCGNHLLKKRCHVNASKESYCDMTCLGKANAERLTGENNPRYTRVKVSCKWCDIEIIRTRTEIIKSTTNRFFCCRKHQGLWRSENLVGDKLYNFKGGYEPYYGENWRSQRRNARERDSYTCQRCGITKEEKGKNPDVHHIKPFRTFGLENYRKANDLSNLICYCNVCHKIVEEQANYAI